jgi:hypothetical protein
MRPITCQSCRRLRPRYSKLALVTGARKPAVLVAALACAGVRCGSSAPVTTPSPPPPAEVVVYTNDFNAPAGTTYPEWSAASYSWTGNQAGTVAAGASTETITNIDSANGSQRFLGELGGPIVLKAPPYDRDHFVRVDESIALSLVNLPRHETMTVTFDLYILKSWDGDSSTFGPDRWSVGLAGSAALLDATFSNNFKTATDRSLQSYPSPGSMPQTGAAAVNTLGYGFWFGDATYHLTFTFPHTAGSAIVAFASSVHEGKAEPSRGTRDESWGLDNVRVTVR